MTGILVLIGLFLLRFVIPIAITVGLGYLLIRLDRRWQAEAKAAREALDEREPAERPGPAQPARPSIRPTPQQPVFALQELPEAESSVPYILPAKFQKKCWELEDCDPARRAACPASKHPGFPCWLARMKVEKTLPASCLSCPIFTQEVARD